MSQHEEIPPELRDQWEEESKAAVMAEYRHRRAGFLTACRVGCGMLAARARPGAERARFPDLADSAASVGGRITARDAEPIFGWWNKPSAHCTPMSANYWCWRWAC